MNQWKFQQECITVGCISPTLPKYGGLCDRGPLDRDLPRQRTPWTETLQTGTPLDRDPPDRDTPGQRPSRQAPPGQIPPDRCPQDRDPPSMNRITDRCKSITRNFVCGRK